MLAIDLCRARGISRAEFARRVGVTPQTLHHWIKRDLKAPVEACPFIERECSDPRVRCETLRPDYDGWEIVRSGSREAASEKKGGTKLSDMST
ncbi:transcriptional regulator [Burkholderia territorii]|uniref:transcriptional regulator n=1 Tax=Burkholderia territorii TaxID=1503055 RepID=UPI001E65AB19|nr:YdaS family helix-turn-helix protein [Burkholderia territorii]